MYIPVELIVPGLAVVAGVISLAKPKASPYAVGVYLIVIGVIELLPHL